MRVSPVGYYYNSIDEVMLKAKESAEATHNHPEGINGAQAIATSIFMAKIGKTKEDIKQFVEHEFSFDLYEKLDSIREWYSFDISCKGSVPQAIIAFLESTDYEDCIRNAISIGGDSDTIACMAGGIAEAYYKVIPDYIAKKVYDVLTEEMAVIVNKFYDK